MRVLFCTSTTGVSPVTVMFLQPADPHLCVEGDRDARLQLDTVRFTV